MDTTRPITRHQYSFRFVKSGDCWQKGIEFTEHLADRMRKHTMFDLESWEDEEQRTRVVRDYMLFCGGTVQGGTEMVCSKPRDLQSLCSAICSTRPVIFSHTNSKL